jgi:cell division protein FtsQ
MAGKRRISRRWLIPAAVVVVVVVAALVVYVSPLLHVRSVEVEGTQNLTADEVRDASGVQEGQNLARLDTSAAASGVSRLPWTDSVTVSRSWPSTVRIDVTEHEAVGVLDDGGDPAVVDADGRLFLRGVTPDGVKKITARADDQGAVTAAAGALAAVRQLDQGLYDQVESADAPGANDVVLKFPEGREVYWGSADRAADKAEATRVVLTREGARWNVSNPGLPSVRE